MNFSGIIVGAAVFLSIGICHPAVIKMEYYWGKKSWWIWLVVGLICCGVSLKMTNQIASTILGGFAFFLLLGHQRDVPTGEAGSSRAVPRES